MTLLVTLNVGADVLLYSYTLLTTFDPSNLNPGVAEYLFVFLVSMQAGMLAVWGTIGRTPWYGRCPAVAIAVLAIGVATVWVFTRQYLEFIEQLGSEFDRARLEVDSVLAMHATLVAKRLGLQTVWTVVPLVAGRIGGGRRLEILPIVGEVRRWQFSLRQMLVWMAATGVLLATTGSLRERGGRGGHAWPDEIAGAIVACCTLLGVWTALWPGRLRWRLSATLALAGLIFGGVTWSMTYGAAAGGGATQWWEDATTGAMIGAVWASVVLFPTANLLVARACGYRWARGDGQAVP